MLESLQGTDVSVDIFRFASPYNLLETLERRGVSRENSEILLGFLGLEIDDGGLDQLIADPFTPKPSLGRRFARSTRYSDGMWPVLYAALEEVTAEREVIFHYIRFALGGADRSRKAYYVRICCAFSGNVKDLRPLAAEWPALVSDDGHVFCQDLGREAVAEGLAGFLAPSARNIGGTSVPVFFKDSLSRPQKLGTTAFSFDNESEQINVTHAQQ